MCRALAAYARTHESQAARNAMTKLHAATGHPRITVGVYGGVVQWVMGNPFPVRIVDYDGEPKDLPDTDDHGDRCTIGFQ